ncbi:unnamed protein product, partial [Notodromas monacha]
MGSKTPSSESLVERQQWGNKIEFLLSSISYAIGFGNIWRFPYLVYRYGGGTFLVPYFFFVITVAMPLMLLESSTAQFAGLGPAHVYGVMCPAFRGLGLTTYYISYVNTIQYVVIMAYVIHYAVSSVTRELPWVKCDPSYSFDGCVGPCSGAGNTAAAGGGGGRGSNNVSDFVVLNGTCWDDYGYVVPGILGSVFIAYVMCFLAMKNGVSTSGKVVYFTALFPYAVLLVLLVKAATLEGFGNGIKFYLQPDLNKLADFEVWYQALSQIFFSLGIGFGGLMTLSRSGISVFISSCISVEVFKVCDMTCWDDYGYVVPGILGSVFIAYVMCFLAMKNGVSTSGKVVYFTALFPYAVLLVLLVKAATLEGFGNGIKFYLQPDLNKLADFEVWYQALSQIFFSLGIGFGGLMTLSRSGISVFISSCISVEVFKVCDMTSSGQDVADVAGSGMSLTFVTFATTLSLLPAAPVWSIMFFVMLITVGLGTQMADMETQITALLDQFTSLRKHKTLVTLVVCATGFLGAISMTFQGGIWLNNLLNDYAATAPVLVMTLGNVVALVYVFGFERLIRNMEEMIGPLRRGTYWYLRITWTCLAPLFVTVLLVYFFYDFPGTAYDKPGSTDLFPDW